MKKKLLIQAVIVSIISISCGNNMSKPSITDNSIHKVKEEKVDYSTIPSEDLLKHIKAHYDLGEYVKGKEKLNVLMENHPDSLNGVDLKMLKEKIDTRLVEIQAKEQEIAERERQKRVPNAINKMRSYKEGKKTIYADKSSPEFDTKECFYAYIVKDLYGVHLNFKIRYVATEWLNIENYMITVDQLDYSLTGEIKKKETKGKKKYKHELLDIPIHEGKQLETLNAIANGSDVTAVYVGKKQYKKRVINEEQRIAIRNVLDAYVFMGGKKTNEPKESYTNTNE